jgi:hypothetical protein
MPNHPVERDGRDMNPTDLQPTTIGRAVHLTVNDRAHNPEVDPRESLLDVLRSGSTYLGSNVLAATSGGFSPAALTCAVPEMDADSVMFSAGHPYESSHEAVARLEPDHARHRPEQDRPRQRPAHAAPVTAACCPNPPWTERNIMLTEGHIAPALTGEQADQILQAMADSFGQQLRSPVLHWPSEQDLDYEDVTFPALDGVPLEGWFMPSPGSDKLIIANHPMGFSRSGLPGHLEPWKSIWASSGNDFEVNLIPDYKILHDAGYNVLAYDLRNLGLSGAANGGIASSGIFEARDVAGSLAYARSRRDTRDITFALFSRCCPCWECRPTTWTTSSSVSSCGRASDSRGGPRRSGPATSAFPHFSTRCTTTC